MLNIIGASLKLNMLQISYLENNMIGNLSAPSSLLPNAKFRYLEFISTIDDDRTLGIKCLSTLSKTVKIKNRPYKGFNFFNEDDLSLLLAIQRGEFNIYGFQNKYLQPLLPNKSSSHISRLLKRLLSHNLIKKIKHTYKYYLTALGRTTVALALKLRELFIIPHLSLCYPVFH